MATYEMGGFIRQLRHERGVTQEQLCDGLCSISTLSKIERGQYTPPGYLFRKLMERLGNYFGRYYGIFLDKHDFEVWKKMEEVNNAIVRNDVSLAEELLAECYAIDDLKSGFGRQFILNSKIGIAILKEVQSAIQAGSPGSVYESGTDYNEWIQMALESIRITIPSFDMDKISTYMLSYEELRAINSLSIAYVYSEEHDKAVQIFKAIAESLDNFCLEMREKARFYAAILANLAGSLYEIKRYDEVIDTCVKGWKFCVEFSRTMELPVFMYCHGKSLIGKGDIEKGRELLRYTYIVAHANKSNAVVADIQSFFMEAFGENIESCDIYPPN